MEAARRNSRHEPNKLTKINVTLPNVNTKLNLSLKSLVIIQAGPRHSTSTRLRGFLDLFHTFQIYKRKGLQSLFECVFMCLSGKRFFSTCAYHRGSRDDHVLTYQGRQLTSDEALICTEVYIFFQCWISLKHNFRLKMNVQN